EVEIVGRLEGRVALVTGAASPRGQGAAEGKLFAGEGAVVVLADVSDDEGRATAAALGDRVAYRHLDVTSEPEWSATVDWIVEQHGRLDVLVNNAGIWLGKGLAETSLDEYSRVIGINQTGVFLGLRAVTPVMRAAGTGSIVNISSLAG